MKAFEVRDSCIYYEDVRSVNLLTVCFALFYFRRQNYGTGIYFDTLAQTSMKYATNTKRLIVVQIIKAPGYFREIEGYHYVVNNPLDRSFTLCLPVLVVSYETSAQPAIKWINIQKRRIPFPFRGTTNLEEGTNNKWKTVFHWHWTTDEHILEPYSDSMNIMLEKRYDSFVHAAGPSVIYTAPVIRYVDGISQIYTISFKDKIQKNVRTGYSRSILRVRVVFPRRASVWKYFNENGVWVPYNNYFQTNIESAYRDYISGKRSSNVTIQSLEHSDSYCFDFILGKQTYVTSQTKYDIIRK